MERREGGRNNDRNGKRGKPPCNVSFCWHVLVMLLLIKQGLMDRDTFRLVSLVLFSFVFFLPGSTNVVSGDVGGEAPVPHLVPAYPVHPVGIEAPVSPAVWQKGTCGA